MTNAVEVPGGFNELWIMGQFRVWIQTNDIPGRRGYCHDVACKKAVSKTSGSPENFFQRFQSATNSIRLGICGTGKRVGLHIRWALIAFSISPPKTCRPGQNADRESIVKYAGSPEWMLTFLNFRNVQRRRHLKISGWGTHPKPIGCS